MARINDTTRTAGRRRLALGLAGATAASLLLAACNAAGQGQGPRVQGWSSDERYGWYRGTQGSRLMPMAWFKALEQPKSTTAFADPTYLAGFGYLPADASENTQLPIGFVADKQPDAALPHTGMHWYAGQKGDSTDAAEPWLGFNCSACHTAEVAYQGKPIRVDGGPGLGDYQSFVEALDAALTETRSDPAKFDRFAAKVLAGKDNAANRDLLGKALDKLIEWQASAEKLNATPLRYGFARVDAFGHIYNKVVLFAGAPDPIINPADAPVSYPFLWNIQKQKKVQWNGAAENSRLNIGARPFEYGAIGRNAGEVLGVFGDATILPITGLGSTLKGFPSSVNTTNLDRLETILHKLEPPPWPAAFPAVDAGKVAAGKALFAQHCSSCHKTPDLQVAGQGSEVMVPIFKTGEANRTDIWMACNAFSYDGRTGALKGTKDGYISGTPFQGTAPVGTMLAATVKGALINQKGDLIKAAVGGFFGVTRPPVIFEADTTGFSPAQLREVRRNMCATTDAPLLAYKARPLDGIWATAPYLHNGSVPTLYDLLLPAAQRPKSFMLGTRDYDPVKVGYVTTAAAKGNRFVYQTEAGGKPIDGNSNVGHDYGAAKMSDADRWAMVEYLKTL